MVARADPGGDEARRLELAGEVEEDGLSALAAQLAALLEPGETAAELLVDDPRALAAGGLRDGQGERVRRLGAGEPDGDCCQHRRAMLSLRRVSVRRCTLARKTRTRS